MSMLKLLLLLFLIFFFYDEVHWRGSDCLFLCLNPDGCVEFILSFSSSTAMEFVLWCEERRFCKSNLNTLLSLSRNQRLNFCSSNKILLLRIICWRIIRQEMTTIKYFLWPDAWWIIIFELQLSDDNELWWINLASIRYKNKIDEPYFWYNFEAESFWINK